MCDDQFLSINLMDINYCIIDSIFSLDFLDIHSAFHICRLHKLGFNQIQVENIQKKIFSESSKKKIEFSANQQLFIQHLNYIRYYNNIEMIWSYERMCIGYMQILYFILGHLWTFLDFVTLWGKWGNPGTSPHRYQETTVIRKEKGFWCVFWFFFSLSLLKIILSLPI